MAPTVETHVEKKKSGIRRLLSPVIFSGEASKRKDTDTNLAASRPSSRHGEVRTSVETAFVGSSLIPRTKTTRKTRSQSLSPVRYGNSHTRMTEGCAGFDRGNGFVNNAMGDSVIQENSVKVSERREYVNLNVNTCQQLDRNRNYATDLLNLKKQNKATFYKSGGSSGSFSSMSSSPVLRSGKRYREGMNRSSENISNLPVSTDISDRSGRTSAPPAPYSQYYNRPDSSCFFSTYQSNCFSSDQIKRNMNQSPQLSKGEGGNEQKLLLCQQQQQQQKLKQPLQQKQLQQQKQPQQQHQKVMFEQDYVIKKRISPIMFSRKEIIASQRKVSVSSSGIPTYSQCRTILRPQPVYNCNTEEISPPPRPRSVSPITASRRENTFVRGSTQRSTITGYHPRQSVIYEEECKDVRVNKVSPSSPSSSKSIPIFKRGTLVSNGDNDGSGNSNVSKKVSFSPGQESASSDPVYWPTRKGLAVEPPTRQSSRRLDLSDCNVYANVPVLPTQSERSDRTDRFLPSVANGHTGYGTVTKTSYQPTSFTPKTKMLVNKWQQHSESESGSEAGEIQRILQNGDIKEEEWVGDAKGRGHTNSEQTNGSRVDDDVRRNRTNRREDPRRHTLSGDHHLSSGYQHNSVNRSIDLESPLSRGYPPPSNSMLFDEDPGIMSEVETSSTGFRRGNKQRSSLPVVRTPSKTLERPLGLVFLQYRNETKRSLMPNEITSLDTVKALFVRSFPKQLTMEYLDSPQVKIYIHDSNKDMFYELEDLRSHLNEIRDRSVLRLFESADVGGGNLPSGLSAPAQMWNDQDQSYFSEPEFDSEFQHQHIHKTKGNKSNLAHQPYYMTHSFPPGSSATLPRGGSVLRPFSPAIPVASKTHAGFMSSPERAVAPTRGYSPYSRSVYEDPYYSQYGSRPSSITPIIDEEVSDTEVLDDGYNLYSGVKLPAAAPGRPPAYGLSTAAATAAVAPPFDATRLRVEHMERQLANLTGLVQKALTQTVPTPSPRERDLSISSDDSFVRTDAKPPKLGKDKSVSFEKSVSFSDDPPEMNSPKQHSPQHTDSKPTKPAIKSSTLPRTSSQERERLKPVPPPKPLTLSPAQYDGRALYRDLQLTPEMYNQLRGLQKKAKDLRQEVRNLRRMSQAQAHSVRETVRDTYIKIRAMVLNGGESLWVGGADSERIKLSREEDIYKQEILRLEEDLTMLESTVEELRTNVINRKARVNMSDVENMALILSKSSKTVADLKLKFPLLQGAMKSVMALEMERVVAEETFLKEEPERLDSALKRCKKLTGTLVTLKRLASVQEQRLPDNRLSPTADDVPVTPTSGKADGSGYIVGSASTVGSGGRLDNESLRAQNTLDSLLDELQTVKSVVSGSSTLRRLHSYSTSETKPPVPERHTEVSGKRVPPPPPPRTSSKSPLASPTNPNASLRLVSSPIRKGSLGSLTKVLKEKLEQPSASNSSSCESINSQEGIQQAQSRQEQLEQRHQELLRKQKALQEQYTRLQQLQKTPPPDLLQLKKTGSESNILAKIGLGISAANISGSMSHLYAEKVDVSSSDSSTSTASTTTAPETKIYETDIL